MQTESRGDKQLPGSLGRMLARGAYSWRADEPHPTFYFTATQETQKAAGKRACVNHPPVPRMHCANGYWKRQFTLAVLLPLPGLVLCGGGIIAMESRVEDWTELSKSCFTPFGTESPLGGPPTKGFGEDLIWKPFCSLSDTPFWVLTACWVCELG